MAGFRGKLNRHIRLKGKTYQFKIGIPAECRAYFKGQQNYVESTGTGDLVTARKWRDRRERELQDLFADIRSGRVVSDDQAKWAMAGQVAREAFRDSEDEDERFLIVTNAKDQSEDLERKPKLQAAFDNAWLGREDVDTQLETWLGQINLAPKSVMDYRGIINRLAAWCKAKQFVASDIDRKRAGQYVEGELLNPDRMTRVTAKKHLGAIVGYWDHLSRRGHLSKASVNPWLNQIIPERGKRGVVEETERAFEDVELAKVLYLDTPVKRGGKPMWEDELKELALISTLSGMRISEITDLTVGACQGGKFDLRKAKTKAGIRVFPIHSALADLIAKRCKDRDDKDLLFKEFDELPNAPDTLSKAFTRRRVALGVNEKREGKRRSLVNFHSFRRTFATKARHAGIPLGTIEDVVGHDTGEKKTVLRESYAKDSSWQQKVDCVEAVKLPANPLRSIQTTTS
ncbi:tyrosine-type recombinase/integrase [Rhizobium sp. BK661]|uniref:tyrosine-type recombinase/integrase n=1 Tax=Rhizobium sp. BK661 TaxID=2586991 RepID=UPI0021683DE3|nr:tyrosine-type recombinase/integrase [Rhizobium sp. BK661]MCS3739330.1 integrase [Rhizobium sp. BK661]